jgi:hypothetical protein
MDAALKPYHMLGNSARVFPDGRAAEIYAPLNEALRTVRRIRRKNDMLCTLSTSRLMPQDKEKRREVVRYNPYELRAVALERKLEPYELGRIMMQFSIRRELDQTGLPQPKRTMNRRGCWELSMF